MPDALDLSALAGTATDYARDNKDHIFSKALAPGVSGLPGTPVKPLDEYVMSIPGNDEVVLTELVMGSVVQPSQYNGFTPKNNVFKIKPRKAKVKPCKVDLKFTQEKIMALWKTYYGQIKGGKINKEEVLFEQFIMNDVIKRIQTDLRNAYINGVRNDAGTSPLDTMDGLFKIYQSEIVSGGVPAANIATIAAITEANAVTQFEKIIDVLPTEYFYQDLVCLTPLSHLKAYERNYRKEYGTLPYNAGFQKQTIEGTVIEFLVEPYMLTTGLTAFEAPLILPRNIIAWLYDDESAQSNLTFDYNVRERDLAWVMDFQVGMDVAMPSLIWSGQV
ncbi:hypothetical protein ACS5NO_20730 [Larkinella sp. GY13]|uniref:hypothetical protein n=1 Tax=Larkinella sp. GY13 TaxID=3453720 RepID=UPI003EEF6086